MTVWRTQDWDAATKVPVSGSSHVFFVGFVMQLLIHAWPTRQLEWQFSSTALEVRAWMKNYTPFFINYLCNYLLYDTHIDTSVFPLHCYHDCQINSLAPGRPRCHFKLQFSISFYWLVSSHRLRIMPWDGCHGTSSMISQHWFKQWLGAVRQQAITWANVDLVPCRHIAWLRHQATMS